MTESEAIGAGKGDAKDGTKKSIGLYIIRLLYLEMELVDTPQSCTL